MSDSDNFSNDERNAEHSEEENEAHEENDAEVDEVESEAEDENIEEENKGEIPRGDDNNDKEFIDDDNEDEIVDDEEEEDDDDNLDGDANDDDYIEDDDNEDDETYTLRTRKKPDSSSPPPKDEDIDENASLTEGDEEDEVNTDVAELKNEGDSPDNVTVNHNSGKLSVKFKFNDNEHKQKFDSMASSPPTSRENSRSGSPTAANRTRHTHRVNYKEMEEYNDEDQEQDQDEERMDDDYYESDEVATRKPDPSRMTARQRDKYLGHSSSEEPDNSGKKIKSKELLSLMDEPTRKTKQLTDEEKQLRRVEQARKRKNFSLKKLEEEKRDTLNKLLMRRAGKVRDLNKLTGGEYGDGEERKETPRRPQLKHKALFRWQSKTISDDKNHKKTSTSLYSIHI